MRVEDELTGKEGLRHAMERCDSRVRFGHDEASFWRDHDTSSSSFRSGRVDGLEETPRDTGRSLEARSVVELLVVVRRAVLDPVACRKKGQWSDDVLHG